MCDTKQRKVIMQRGVTEKSKVKNPKNDEMLMGRRTHSGLNSVVIATISAVVTLAVIGVGFVLFNVINFDQTTERVEVEVGDNNRGTSEIDDSEVSLAVIELSTNDISIMNQSNQSSWLVTNFITEDAIYFVEGGSRIVNRTTDYFATYDFVADLGHWTSSIHVIEDAIYFTVMAEIDWEEIDVDEIDWDEWEWQQYLYRYCLSSGQSIRVADEIFNEVIVDNLVFHQRESFDGDLYVLDLITGDRRLLIEDIRNFDFVIDPENDRIIFKNSSWDDRHVYQTNLLGENKTVLLERAFTFVVGSNLIAWEEGSGTYLMNLDTAETTSLDIGNDLQLWTAAFLGEYLVISCWNNYLWLVDPNDSGNHHQIAEDVLIFTLLGDYIIHSVWEDWENIYIIDLNGNSEIFRSFSDWE